MLVEIYWIWLSRLKHVGPILQKLLIQHFSTPKEIYEANPEELSQVPKMTKNALLSISTNHCLKEAENILKSAKRGGINILLLKNKFYPTFAKEYKESPIVLYYRGEIRPLQKSVGVVGARRCTSYGKKIAERIGDELAAHKIPVISGFAKGIDSYAQAACIKKGGYTVAFLGCGPDICYPPEQRKLYHQILEKGGAFISQYPPGTPPNPKYFLARNAHISAWSTELVIVEAGEQSGALWTADFALKNNRQIYAVPNQIDVPEGMGTNNLLAKGIPPYLGLQSLKVAQEIKHQPIEIPKETNPILQLLSHSPVTIQQLSTQTKLDVPTLMDNLIDLEFDKKVIIRGDLVYKL